MTAILAAGLLALASATPADELVKRYMIFSSCATIAALRWDHASAADE